MTRNEACRLYRAKVIGNGVGGFIDFFIESGMLKVEEEKTVEERVLDILYAHDISGPASIINLLDEVGLKIVEKDK